MSLCMIGFLPSGIFGSSMPSISFCWAMSGAGNRPRGFSQLPKSNAGAKYAFPQGCLNSVTSVPIFSHGPSAAKWRPAPVLEGLPDDALVGVVPVVVGLAADAAGIPISRIILSTVLSAMRAPSSAQAHRDLAVAAPVRRPVEDLDGLADSGLGVGLGGWRSA